MSAPRFSSTALNSTSLQKKKAGKWMYQVNKEKNLWDFVPDQFEVKKESNCKSKGFFINEKNERINTVLSARLKKEKKDLCLKYNENEKVRKNLRRFFKKAGRNWWIQVPPASAHLIEEAHKKYFAVDSLGNWKCQVFTHRALSTKKLRIAKKVIKAAAIQLTQLTGEPVTDSGSVPFSHAIDGELRLNYNELEKVEEHLSKSFLKNEKGKRWIKVPSENANLIKEDQKKYFTVDSEGNWNCRVFTDNALSLQKLRKEKKAIRVAETQLVTDSGSVPLSQASDSDSRLKYNTTEIVETKLYAFVRIKARGKYQIEVPSEKAHLIKEDQKKYFTVDSEGNWNCRVFTNRALRCQKIREGYKRIIPAPTQLPMLKRKPITMPHAFVSAPPQVRSNEPAFPLREKNLVPFNATQTIALGLAKTPFWRREEALHSRDSFVTQNNEEEIGRPTKQSRKV